MRHAGKIIAGCAAVLLGCASVPALAQGPHPHRSQFLSGTYLDPAIQRHDLFPRPIWNNVPEYRQVYNRPRYKTGKFLYHFEPTSQEAMAWETNVHNGNYRNARGAFVPMYYYPKPWESLNTRSRPDFPRQGSAPPTIGTESEPEAIEPARP